MDARTPTRLPHRPARPRQGGFTLVELLVAVGLTAIMLWGLLQLFSQATRFSSAVTSETELTAAGRAALGRMASELAGAAGPPTGYLKITDGGDFDSVQFVAPVGEGGISLAHVRYYGDGSGASRTLMRGLNETAAPSKSSATCTGTSFGVDVERLNIRHITSSGNISSSGLTVTSSGTSMPRAVLIEVRLRDREGLATVTLSTAAYLPSGGL